MKGTDRTVLIVLPVVALLAAFWFLVLSPKREEASTLQDQVTQLESEVAQNEQAADFAEQAREDYPDAYKKVVTLGKAVPQDDDTASLLAQISGISAKAGVDFRTLELAAAGDSASVEATAPPVAETTPPPAEGAAPESAPADTAAPVTSAPIAATEASAAALPIGATVGPAGLPVMPYKLRFTGDFFHVADFVHGLDGSVSTADGNVSVDGRLITVDGFSLTQDTQAGFPSLIADFTVTTYITPSTEGLTSGATPSGPAPVSDSAAPTQAVEQTSTTTEIAP